MAMSLRRSCSRPALSILGLALLTATGCGQRTPTQTMNDARPKPNFGGPNLVKAPEPVRPAPPVKVTSIKPTPNPQVVRVPQPSATAGIPRDWTPPIPANSWKWIVVHHSATPVGGAGRFNKEHVAKGWDELGYHFVIGNGTDTANGGIEVGSRWPKQKQGAHCKTPNNEFNDRGIGICLVGNFDQSRPTDAQLKSLAKLVAHLQKTYRIPAERIIGHGDAKATECPGRNL